MHSCDKIHTWVNDRCPYAILPVNNDADTMKLIIAFNIHPFYILSFTVQNNSGSSPLPLQLGLIFLPFHFSLLQIVFLLKQNSWKKKVARWWRRHWNVILGQDLFSHSTGKTRTHDLGLSFPFITQIRCRKRWQYELPSCL